MTMIAKNDLLKRVRIATPCPAAWEQMDGDERVRFCGSCRQNVYNLSEMTRDEALALVRRVERGERHCFRFYQRKDGTMLTRDCPFGVRRLRRRLAPLELSIQTVRSRGYLLEEGRAEVPVAT